MSKLTTKLNGACAPKNTETTKPRNGRKRPLQRLVAQPFVMPPKPDPTLDFVVKTSNDKTVASFALYPAFGMKRNMKRHVCSIIVGMFDSLHKNGVINQPLNVEISFLDSSSDNSVSKVTEKKSVPFNE